MIKHAVACYIIAFSFFAANACAQQKTLTLKEAEQIALANYGTIKAKANYVKASRAAILGSRSEYLPDLSISAQQDYGTINGQSGPLYGFRGLSVASGGPAMESQNWTGAFGALYLANISWDFFSFGRVRERINISSAALKRDENDFNQEVFQHQIRVAAAYLNLLAAQRLTRSWEKNLERTSALVAVVIARTRSGLNPGVDSSLANAEISSAKIAIVRARDFEQEQGNQLANLMGVTDEGFILDSVFLSRIPSTINDTGTSIRNNPLLTYYQSLIGISDLQVRYLHTLNYPTFSLFSVIQSRGSGFAYNYGSQYPGAYTGKYLEGVKPNRGNYLAGVGLVWNLTSPLRIQHQVAAQRFASLALRNDYEQADRELSNQLLLAENKIKNAMDNYREAPIQVKAASDAYLQKSVLYKNGLNNIVDITQALYTLNRAETDRDIAFSNVWQALLLKAAATGNFGLFINEF